MIGVFDSGVGGLISYRKLRELLPSERIVYLADTGSAPYGTKSEEELRRLIDADISKLRSLGCDYILAACCTASAVIEKMPKESRSSIGTLIEPTAILASRTEGAVAVIATEYTAKSHAFKNAIERLDPTKKVIELAEQGLVALVERGARDGYLDPESEGYLDRLAGRIKESGATALILGCTHFSHLSGELGKRLPELSIISPALEGARMAARMHRIGTDGCLSSSEEISDLPDARPYFAKSEESRINDRLRKYGTAPITVYTDGKKRGRLTS